MPQYRIIKQGYMLKEPPYSKRGVRKKLKRFWFVLLEDKKQVAFVYYKNEDAYIARQRNVGFIKIDNSRINVVGEYLTHKNAFQIVTEKSEYTFVSETRYELHDWILVLHNTMEGFHRRMERVKVCMEQRQRALSASSAASDNLSSQASPIPTQQPGATPPTPRRSITTPNRTPPNGSPKTGSSSRRRPRRPAPVAPQQSRDVPPPFPRETDHTPNHTHQEFPRQYSDEGPIPIPQVPAFSYGGEHTVLDLDITQIEETLIEEGEGEREEEREEEEERYVLAPIHTSNVVRPQANGVRPIPLHQRSVSDTSVLLYRANSASLPELAEQRNSASPEPVSDTVEGAKRQISLDSPTKKFRMKHTRHLSLLGGDHHKRKKRRSQIRSRSPPSYPPPPPPADEESGDEVERTHWRKDSFGFSKVMQTISSIDQELQEMGGVAGANTAADVPPPTMFHGEDPTINPANDSLEEGAQSENPATVEERGEGEEERPTHIEISPTQQAEGKEETSDRLPAGGSAEEDPSLDSPTKKIPPPVAAKPKPKPKRNKVMFKEEVEDIPSYEPRIDDEEAPPTEEEGSEDIPSSVAALKKMLFGQASTQKYSKEGPMSLRFGAFVDTEDYDEGLHEMLTPTSQQGQPQLHDDQQPNHPDPHYQHLTTFNDSTNSETGGEVVRGEGEGEGGSSSQPWENEYDTPWDSKPISKFSVVGHRGKLTPSPAHRTESFEVVSHTTDLPGNMERRNVSSLERQLKNDPTSRVSPRQDLGYSGGTYSQPSSNLEFTDTGIQDSDLLQSISTTLQTRSKYGSDSLLTSFSQGDVPANYYQQQGRAAMQQAKSGVRSARGDLEKIRTKHKRAITLPTSYSGPQTSKLKHKKALSRSHQSVSHSGVTGDGGRGQGRATSYHGGGGPARKAQSVDMLQVDPSTLVTYNTYTKSHTLQSLV